MMNKAYIIGGLVAIVFLAGGYAIYDHLKNEPPDWLVDLVSKPSPPPSLPEGEQAPLAVPDGFAVQIFARDLPGARVLARDNQGTLLLSQTEAGKVVALPDRDGDGQADETVVVVEGLNQPHGLLVVCDDTCLLYVAETNALISYDYDPVTFNVTNKKTLATFPSGRGHYTRTLLEHPDGEQILISVGSSCNVCEEESPLRATVQSFNVATGEMSEFARGLRNTVFMATDPVTGEVWGTDNGRDLIGDDIPPDEVNILKLGEDYGWPICYGQNIHDTDFDKRQYIQSPCADKTVPHIELPAHSAALGLAFIPEEGWPDGWGNDLMVAYHGSWNRSEPTGYKVVRIDLDDNSRDARGDIADFFTGFISPGASEDESIGRPVAVLAEPGGVLYVTDDRAGAVYRVTRTSLE